MCGVRPASLTLKVMNSSEELVDAPAEGPFGPGWASVAVMASTRRQTLAPPSLACAKSLPSTPKFIIDTEHSPMAKLP